MRFGMRIGTCFCAALLLAFGATMPAAAVDQDAQEALDACRVLEDPLRRLACYDAIPGANLTGQHELLDGLRPAVQGGQSALGEETVKAVVDIKPETSVARSRMMRAWELDDVTHGGLLRVRTYQPVYVLPLRYTTRRNSFPDSPAAGRSVTESDNLDSIEAKFQLSFKAKLLDNMLGDNGDLWFAFTQQSSWQAYNGVESAPFRETNYSPEVFATWRTGLNLGPLRWQFANFGFVHQSNGRSQPRSRSWNRIYADFGFERGDWQVFIRPWLRVEVDNDDDNPDIEDFLGHGDVRVKWRRNRHDLGALIRYNAGTNRGALQLEWHYPLVGDLKGYLQIFTGYGETLIDYNHRQTTIGVGISLVQ